VPGVRGLVVALACAVGALLGLSGATLADATLAACGGERAGPVGVRLSGVVCDQREDQSPAHRTPPLVAIATRHAVALPRPLPPGVENPVTDRALALLIGWTMLALIGGGLFAGRRRRV
jgi:hypothetical protein